MLKGISIKDKFCKKVFLSNSFILVKLTKDLQLQFKKDYTSL